MSASTAPVLCELWVRGQGDGVLDAAALRLRENSGACEGGALYFRFAGLAEGKAASPAGCCLRLDVPALGQKLLLPEALSGPFSPGDRLRLERMNVPAYAVVRSPAATEEDWDRLRRTEGQDRHGRPLSLTGIFTVAADLERALGAALVVARSTPSAARAGRRERERYDGVTRRRCGRGAKRLRGSGTLPCCPHSTPVTPCSDAGAAEAARPSEPSCPAAVGVVSLGDLVDGPYLQVASYMDRRTLCRADAACRALRGSSCAHGGAWRAWGERMFHGIELWESGDTYEPHEDEQVPCWKRRFGSFAREVATFRPPFGGVEIRGLDHPDECAQLRCRLNAEVLADPAGPGIFLELEVASNPDHVTLALVDWDAGGRSSVTFSPTTGTVFRERIVGDAPRRIRGDYVQRLYAALPGVRFEGSVGLYVQGGRLAFFRRWMSSEADDFTTGVPVWETTGFVTDLSWAQGPQLTPCLAFCKEGSYHVGGVRVSPEPPVRMQQVPAMCDEAAWKRFDWE